MMEKRFRKRTDQGQADVKSDAELRRRRAAVAQGGPVDASAGGGGHRRRTAGTSGEAPASISRGGWRPSLLAALALVCALLTSTAIWPMPPVAGQEAPDGAKAAAGKQATESEGERAKPRGRLPAYFSRVVSATQREEIYAIQAKFNERIEELQEQLDDLIRQRDQAVEEVLTDEQRSRVESYRAEARARRAERSRAEPVEAGGETDGATDSTP